MIDCVYYNNELRCYRDGRVERLYGKSNWLIGKHNNNDNGYNKVVINKIPIRRHRLIAFCFLGLENIIGTKGGNDVIDHIDHNKLNNAVENLRITTPQGNNQNKTCKGYYYDKREGKFCSKIMLNRKHIHIGYYPTEPEARQAYLDAKQIYHLI